MPKRILVVDNEVRSRESITYFLREANYAVEEADDGVTAIAMLDKIKFDLIICDVVMPRLGAFEVMNYLKSRSLSTSVILITGHRLFACGKRARPLARFFQTLQHVRSAPQG